MLSHTFSRLKLPGTRLFTTQSEYAWFSGLHWDTLSVGNQCRNKKASISKMLPTLVSREPGLTCSICEFHGTISKIPVCHCCAPSSSSALPESICSPAGLCRCSKTGTSWGLGKKRLKTSACLILPGCELAVKRTSKWPIACSSGRCERLCKRSWKVS